MADTRIVIQSGFYDSLNHDRVYSADDMNKPYSQMMIDGIFEGGFAVEASGDSSDITIDAGQALLAGKWVEADATTADLSEYLTDMFTPVSVILQVDMSTDVRGAAIIIRVGAKTASDTPTYPALINTDTTKELRLADILLWPASPIIESGEVHDRRGGDECPYVKIKVGDTQIRETVEDVLEDHPEWTTTVQDGSITAEKLASSIFDHTLSVAGKVADAKDVGDKLTDLKSDLSKLGLSVVNGELCVTYAE